MHPIASVTLVAVIALLVADWRGSPAGIWIAKPLASAGFLAAAVACGAMDTAYGRAVLAALALSFAGDVLLIPEEKSGALRVGIASFLAAHVAFIAAFWIHGTSPGLFGSAVAVLALPAALVLRWLVPHLSGDMKPAVFAYVAVITAMVAAAAATGRPDILLGAGAFFASDLSVARDRFVAPGFVNRVWGWPLYYAAQLLLASTVSV